MMWDTHEAARRRVEQLLVTLLQDMEPDDAGLILDIVAAAGTQDAAVVLRALDAYYSDFARAERTPRAFLYLHLGILVGLVRASYRGEP